MENNEYPAFDVHEIQPSASVRDRNEQSNAAPGNDDNCAVCGKPMTTGPGTAWIECVDGALYAYPKDAPQLDPNSPEETQHGILMCGYMGCFPVGPSCAKKIPARYLHIYG